MLRRCLVLAPALSLLLVGVTPAHADTAPSLSWLTPASGDSVSGDVALSVDAHATGADLTSVEFYADGALVDEDFDSAEADPTGGTYQAVWSSSGSSGPVTLLAIAHDSLGGATQLTLPVTAPSSPPPPTPGATNATITSPAAGTVLTPGPLTVSVNATPADGATISFVEIYAGATLLTSTLSSSGTYDAVWNSADAEGPVTITASAFDDAGGQADTSIDVVVRTGSRLALVGATTIPYAGTTALKATALTTLGSPITGSSVALWRRANGQPTFSVLSRATTNAYGVATFTVRPLANTDYYTTYAGTDTMTGSKSNAQRVSVATKPVLHLPTVAKRTVPLRGYVSLIPSFAGQPMMLQTFSAGAWHNVRRFNTVGGNTVLSVTFPARGTYGVRVLRTANAAHVQSASNVAYVKVS